MGLLVAAVANGSYDLQGDLIILDYMELVRFFAAVPRITIACLC